MSRLTSDAFIRNGGILAAVLLILGGLIRLAIDHVRLFGYEQTLSTLLLLAGTLVASLVVVGLVVGARVYLMKRRRMKKQLKAAHYDSIDFNWVFQANGDFQGRYVFKLVNGSGAPLSALPAFDIIVWRKSNLKSVRYGVLNAPSSQKLHRFEKNGHHIVESISKLLNMDYSRVAFDLFAYPAVNPGEHMTYEIAVETIGSEVDAFTAKGNVLGIPAHIPIRKARLHCLAPQNFRFVLAEPIVPFVVDMKGNRQPDESHDPLPGPTLAPGGGSLKWELSNIGPERRYWLRYRFEEQPYDV